MKDMYDLPDGTESSVHIKLTNTWETYEEPIDQFETAEKKILKIPLGHIFAGNKRTMILVRSIQFK